MHGVVHLPRELVQPGKAGDILRGLLRRGHYVALVSRMVDALVEETEVMPCHVNGIHSLFWIGFAFTLIF